MKRIISALCLINLFLFLAGCGETVHGVIKDTTRIGEGVHKIFIRDTKK